MVQALQKYAAKFLKHHAISNLFCNSKFLKQSRALIQSWLTYYIMGHVQALAYDRRSEAAPPKLPKCLSTVEPKLTSCAVLQEGACVPWTINLTLVSLFAMFENRLLEYVKDNDVHYGLKVAHRDPKSSKVTGLQCRGCIAFGREEKVGSKRKAANPVQGRSHPFRYNNIENHLCNRHFGQWALYRALESSSEGTSFFDDVPVLFKNSCMSHTCKTNLVHKKIRTLINVKQSFYA
jgi:hypothetical protein